MEHFNFVVVWNTGKKPEVVLISDDKGVAESKFQSLLSDSNIDNLRLFSNVNATRRASPSEMAKIVEANNKRLRDEEEAEANKEKLRVESEISAAEEKLKAAKAKAKELGIKV